MRKPVTAVVFDLDGTLVDSHREIAHATNVTLRALGRPEHPAEAIKGMIGHGARHLLSLAVDTDDPGLIDEARKHFLRAYLNSPDPAQLYDGIAPALEQLRADGLVLAIATNKPAAATRPTIERLGLVPEPFCAWASADEVPRRKPDPAVLQLALDRAGSAASPEQTIYVGDSPVDVEAARRFGCRAIGVTWGFDQTAVIDSEPDALAAQPARLADVVRRLSSGQRKS